VVSLEMDLGEMKGELILSTNTEKTTTLIKVVV
jgi:hypothetical protein